MRFDQPLQPGVLKRRYKRFLADVALPDGHVLTCHCPNTGSMLGCATPESRVWLSRASNPRRKYAYTWEIVEVATGALVGIHTGRTNALVREAIGTDVVPELKGYRRVDAEVSVADAPMRADFHLREGAGKPDCFVEVKNVTAAVDAAGIAVFPDAVSERGRRHLEVMTWLVRETQKRAVTIFCAQRDDVTAIQPADRIDPAYGRALRAAHAAGVELIGLAATVTPQGITVDRRVPVVLPTLNDNALNG